MVVFFILFLILSIVYVHNLMEHTYQLPSEKRQCWKPPHLVLIAYLFAFFDVFRLYRKQAPFLGMEKQS